MAENVNIDELIELVKTTGLGHYGNKDLPSNEKYYINNAEYIGQGFADSGISGLVLQEDDLNGDNPIEIINSVFNGSIETVEVREYGLIHELLTKQLIGDSDTYNQVDTVLLIVENNDGTTDFYYKSTDDDLTAKTLEGAIGKTTTENTGDFLYEHLTQMKNINMGLEGLPVSETKTIVETEPDPTTENSLPDIVTSGIVISSIIFTIGVIIYAVKTAITDQKKEGQRETFVPKKTKPTYTDYLNDELKEMKENIQFQQSLNKNRPLSIWSFKNNKKFDCYKELSILDANVNYLIQLVEKQNDKKLLQQISIEYTKALDSLNRLVSENYWGDIVKHPAHYPDANNKITEVLLLIKRMDKKILSDTKKLKANKMLDYDIDMKTIENITNMDNNDLEEFITIDGNDNLLNNNEKVFIPRNVGKKTR